MQKYEKMYPKQCKHFRLCHISCYKGDSESQRIGSVIRSKHYFILTVNYT